MRNRKKNGVIQILIVAGMAIVIISLFWIVATFPASSLIALYQADPSIDADIASTALFIQIFISVLPLLAGLSVIAWGWVRTVEERETGFSSF